MNLFYAERYGDMDAGEPYIAERGVFTSVEEFMPYREQGWLGTKDLDDAADAMLAARKKEWVS